MNDKKHSAEEAFREAADRRAALELRLSEADRARFAALIKKQDTEREREHRRLEQRKQDYEVEQRKQKTTLTLDMIQRDGNAPRALRDAAREYAAQQHWVSDLDRLHDKQRDKFLDRAVNQRQQDAADPENAREQRREDDDGTGRSRRRKWE